VRTEISCPNCQQINVAKLRGTLLQISTELIDHGHVKFMANKRGFDAAARGTGRGLVPQWWGDEIAIA